MGKQVGQGSNDVFLRNDNVVTNRIVDAERTEAVKEPNNLCTCYQKSIDHNKMGKNTRT